MDLSSKIRAWTSMSRRRPFASENKLHSKIEWHWQLVSRGFFFLDAKICKMMTSFLDSFRQLNFLLVSTGVVKIVAAATPSRHGSLRNQQLGFGMTLETNDDDLHYLDARKPGSPDRELRKPSGVYRIRRLIGVFFGLLFLATANLLFPGLLLRIAGFVAEAMDLSSPFFAKSLVASTMIAVGWICGYGIAILLFPDDEDA